MPKFSVDVKAFVKVDVEASDVTAARKAADAWVEDMPEGISFVGAVKSASVDVDGTSEVEQICQHSYCDNELTEADEKAAGLCFAHLPEEDEVPLDTPSLDTSFHDHEMNV